MKIYAIYMGGSGPAWMEGEAKETPEFYIFPNRNNDWATRRIGKRLASKTKAEALQIAQAYAEQQVRRYTGELADAQAMLAKVQRMAGEETAAEMMAAAEVSETCPNCNETPCRGLTRCVERQMLEFYVNCTCRWDSEWYATLSDATEAAQGHVAEATAKDDGVTHRTYVGRSGGRLRERR